MRAGPTLAVYDIMLQLVRNGVRPWSRGGVGALLISLLGVTACQDVDADPTGDATSAHSEGEYIEGNHPLYWTDQSYEEFETVRGISFDMSLRADVPPEDVTRVWLQAWADRIDEIVRARVRQDTGSELLAPQPKLHVLPSSSTSNAWVTPIPVCLPWKVRFRDAPPDAPPSGLPLLFSHEDDRVDVVGQRRQGADWVANCADRSDRFELSDKQLFVSRWNERFASWDHDYDEQRQLRRNLRLTSDGAIEASMEGYVAGSERMAMFSVSPHIHFTSPMLEGLSESGAVFVVAHELAHYYRAHGSPLKAAAYGFFYEQDSSAATRPVPASDSVELRRTYQSIMGLGASHTVEVPGSAWSPMYRGGVLGPVVDMLENRLRTRPVSDDPCSEVVRIRDRARRSFRDLGSLVHGLEEDVLRMEQQLLPACAQGIRLTADEQRTLGLLLSYDGLWSTDQPMPEDLPSVLTALRDTAAARTAFVADFLERFGQGRIGLYTTEQEADDLALEWVNRLGFSSDDAIRGWLDHLAHEESLRRTFPATRTSEYPTSADCRALYEANFTDGARPIRVSLGDLADPHHGGCYRVYNMWREQRAHRHAPAGASPRPSVTWAQVQERARELTLAR